MVPSSSHQSCDAIEMGPWNMSSATKNCLALFNFNLNLAATQTRETMSLPTGASAPQLQPVAALIKAGLVLTHLFFLNS